MKSVVKDVMTKDVVLVEESVSFKRIVQLMTRHGVSALPVVDDSGFLVGIVSEADLMLKEEDPGAGLERGRWLEPRKRRLERHKAAGKIARELMTAPVVAVRSDETVREAARRMHEHAVKRLPVVNGGGRVVGIVSRADVLKVFLRSDREIRDEVEKDVLVRTLWMETDAIQLTVQDGVVALRGRVERKAIAELLKRLVREIDGVVDVESELSYEIDDTLVRPEHWPLAWPSRD